MSWVAVDQYGDEFIYKREPLRHESIGWSDSRYNSRFMSNTEIGLPLGSIKKLIGRELSWEDEAVELKE